MKTKFLAPMALVALAGLSGCAAFKSHSKHTPTVGNRIPILMSENGIEADKTIANVQVLLPAPTNNDSWTQSGGNASKSMGHLAMAATPSQVWQASINGGSTRQPLAAPPVVADKKLFVIDVDSNVQAFSADTGASLWSTTIAEKNRYRASRFGGGVSYDDGQVFATDGLGDVVALSAATGKVAWRAKPGGPLRGAPTIANGVLYVLTQDNQIFALDEGTGKVQWTGSGTLETQGVFGVAAPAASQGSVVAGFSSGELNAYRYENGRVLWQDALSRTSVNTSVSSLSDVDADPVIDDGKVYAVGQGGRMVALQLSTGQRLWEQNLAGISTPWVAGDWLFVVTDDARLICLARATGKARWIAQLPRYHKQKNKSGPINWYGPVLAGNRLVLTNSDGDIDFVLPGDGTVAHTIEGKRSAGFSLPPVVANQTLYVLDGRGRVTAYR